VTGDKTGGKGTVIRFTDEEFAELVAFISQNYGIDLTKKRILAECRLNSDIKKSGQTSLGGYLRQIKHDKTGRLETELLNRLTTNYTFFLRENKHFEFLEKQILPEIPSGADSPVYRIWCAGCSSGEECYTLSMYFHSYMKQHGVRLPFHILGTDISEKSLKKAEEGRYALREISNIPEQWQQEYCLIDRENECFTIRPEIRQPVRFCRMNLMKPFAGQRQYDLILCRNVMIYFNEESRKRLLEGLYDSMKKGGYLFLGHTELLPRNHEFFQYICPAVYRK